MASTDQDRSVFEDLQDLVLVLSRTLTDDGARITFDELLALYGLTYDDLAAIPDDEG